jgi:hypothetical protein
MKLTICLRLLQICNYIILAIFFIIKLVFYIINLSLSKNITNNIFNMIFSIFGYVITYAVFISYYFLINDNDMENKSKLLIFGLHNTFNIFPFIISYIEFYKNLEYLRLQFDIITYLCVILYCVILINNVIDFLLSKISYNKN